MNDTESKINEYKRLCYESYQPLTLEKAEEIIKKRMGVINEEFLAGFELISKYSKSVTFFGSSKFTEDNEYYIHARNLAAQIVKETQYAVVSGGGPGIMEAANRGAFEADGSSLGLVIKLSSQPSANKYLTDSQEFIHFFIRKVILSFSAETYLFFPGGFGTLDELFELLTLIQTKKIPRVPIILVGSKYWNQVDKFMKNTLLKDIKALDQSDMEIYQILDSNDEIIEIIKNAPMRKE